MKRLVAVTWLLVTIAVSVHAQHGGARGGFSSHSAPAFQSRSAASRSFGGSPHIARSGSYGVGRRTMQPGRGAYAARPNYFPAGRYRRPDRSHGRLRIAYGVPVTSAWLGVPWLPENADYDDAAPGAGYDAQTSDYGPQPVPFDYQGNQSTPQTQAAPEMPNSSAPIGESAVTLVYKDGRPREQIYNYMLTTSTLYVLDQQRRDIPLDQLDIAATRKVNHDAGIDFALPTHAGG